MKVRVVFCLFLIILITSACSEDKSNYCYPDGLEIVDFESENDCTLSECSEDRVMRLIANNVKGKIIKDSNDDFHIDYTCPIDTYIQFFICDLPDEFQVDGLDVKFDGRIYDACGIRDAVFGGQEIYLLMITDIKKD